MGDTAQVAARGGVAGGEVGGLEGRQGRVPKPAAGSRQINGLGKVASQNYPRYAVVFKRFSTRLKIPRGLPRAGSSPAPAP
jgi:hypothetical protein